jgi:serine/threonine-protein kinase PknK
VTVAGLALPSRYESLSPLGKGGGGEVWAVRDRISGRTVALKTLGEKATEREVQALVREAVALSGLEGLGAPRVLRFGRLPKTGLPFMIRELVEGRSLLDLIDEGAPPGRCLEAIALTADQLTVLHRASLLHGDVKPANIIVGKDGAATLVDLGLAAPWKDGGARPEGLTPRYAAPELFTGAPLSVRAEIFALGATLDEVLERLGSQLSDKERRALSKVAGRATADEPSDRFPSADELAMELRRAGKLPARERLPGPDASWPIVGIDGVACDVMARIEALGAGQVLLLEGPKGSGRSALLRRAAWSLGIAGRAIAWVDAAATGDPKGALGIEMSSLDPKTIIVMLDDAERLDESALAAVEDVRARGARIVLTAARPPNLSVEPLRFAVPPLEASAARDLVRRAIPSLSDAVLGEVIARAEGRPGRLRSMVRRLEGHTVVSSADLGRILEDRGDVTVNSIRPEPILLHCSRLLDQGRFDEAMPIVEQLAADRGLSASIARARLALGRGDNAEALRELSAVEPLAAAEAASSAARAWALYASRAHLRLGDYAKAEALADQALRGAPDASLEAEALTVRGVVQSYQGRVDEARATLQRAAGLAQSVGDRRVEGLVLASLAFVLQRADRLAEAKQAYEAALEVAEAASDAGAVATTRLNLAALVQGQGDFGAALSHLEAAVDMGKRAGRRSTTQQALLNLANLDLYLGRYARARTSIERLFEEESALPQVARAQLYGLRADLAARTGAPAEAVRLYQACAVAYDGLGRGIDAAESRLESILLRARSPDADANDLGVQIEEAASLLKEAPAHRAMMLLARGAVAALRRDRDAARRAYDDALASARAEGQKEWIWRALERRSRLSSDQGDHGAARKDIEEALLVLEQVASVLPRDLREVYWDDARRRELRARAGVVPAMPTTPPNPKPTAMATTLHAPDDRLSRILEINRELAAEHDLPRLLERVTDFAIELLRAERGMVILAGQGGELAVHASRDREGDDPHARFSKGIAEKVIRTGEAVVSQSVRDDEQMAGYVSVHQLMLQSVACVPIAAPGGRTIGALYLETRLRPGLHFGAELPTLRAFADQVAIAIENARLVTEAAERARELEVTNRELTTAQGRLDELLAQKTSQLDEARRDLRSTKAVLRSHFGYHGLVGTSAPMRKLYALVDRIKDTDVPVLISGESGTGKEIVARAIHQAGHRAKHAFTGINCGAIPEHLLESELFGHVRGAFTGADRDHKGLVRESEGGTILLDEIGEMPKKMQAGLLRVLQEKVVRPVGGAKEIAVDVRVIAATNRDLSGMVEEGAFREDLYYRLHVVEVLLPALRDRLDDLPVLIDHFFKIFAARFRTEKKVVSRDALRKLTAYVWPGNVRQLENVLLSAWVMSERAELGPDDFDLPAATPRRGSATPSPCVDPTADAPAAESVRGRSPVSTHGPGSKRAPSSKRGAAFTRGPASSRGAPRSSGALGQGPPSAGAASRRAPSTGRADRDLVGHKQREKDKILGALQSCNWNRVRAAQIVGLPRRTFYRRLREYGIQ